MDRGNRGRDTERGGRGGREEETRGRDRGGRGGRGGSEFNYHRRDASALKSRAEKLGGSDFDSYFREGTKLFKPNDGDNIIRILPPTWKEADHYGLDLWVHYSVGPDEQTYLCLDKMKGEPCPLCDERARAVKDKDDDYADSLKPKQRVAIAIIDRDNEKEGVQIWAMPWGIDKDLLSRAQDKRTGEVLYLDDPENGYDVEFTREGKGLKTKYVGIALARRESPIGDDRWLQEMIEEPLPDRLCYFSYDHIQQVFGGGSSGGGKSRDRDTTHSSDRKQTDKQDDELREVEQRGSRREVRTSEPELSWESVHGMTFEELVSIIEDKRLDKIDPKESKDDDELADWICEDLDIKKTPARRAVSEDKGGSDVRRDLENMRRNRDK